ncbi:MAG: type II 3-dehydroquinate dehydratase [Bacteroidales bacterium]|nr:type II 3-dehydroquinate dehydratase [Bacteroidales bacterium]
MKILVINGPNLNLLGKRQPEIYGKDTLADIAERVDTVFGSQAQITWWQSNHEGEIIDRLHDAGYGKEKMDGIVLNAGAYTHTSLALADAIAAIPVPVVEVHLSNIFSREEIRHRSLIAPVCCGSISGFGWHSYLLAVEALLMKKTNGD